MLSRCHTKRIAWVLVAALLNLVFVAVPGSGAVFAASHVAGGRMQGAQIVVQGQPSCHADMAQPVPEHKATGDDFCPDCEEGCTLCFQIPAAIPVIAVRLDPLPEAFADTDIPRLTGVIQTPVSPPPRSLSS